MVQLRWKGNRCRALRVGRVDDNSAHRLIGKMLFLDAVDPTTPIILYINSGGGVVSAVRPATSTAPLWYAMTVTVLSGIMRGDLGKYRLLLT